MAWISSFIKYKKISHKGLTYYSRNLWKANFFDFRTVSKAFLILPGALLQFKKEARNKYGTQMASINR